ncbi:hypothetical protein Tco_0104935 [Tanacetum coccineum]
MIYIFNVPNYIGFKDLFAQLSGNPTIQSNDSFSSSSPMKTSDSTLKEFTDKFTLPNSSPPGDDVSILKKDFQEETFQITSNPLFEFNDSFKSSNVNPLFEENDKDVEIKSSSSSTLTSPEASELEDYLEKDSIPPGIDLTLPTTLEVSKYKSTFPTSHQRGRSELSASVTLNSLRNEDKVFKPEPPNECLKNAVLNFYQSKKTFPLNVEDVNSFAFIMWNFLPFFTYNKEFPFIFSFRSEIVFDPGILTNPVQFQ